MDMQGLEFKDFSGGQTDYFIDAPINKFEEADNFLIFKHGPYGRLFTRPGSEIYDATNPQVSAGNQRVGTLKYFNSELLIHSARKFEHAVAGTNAELVGPSSNSVFPSGVTVTDVVSLAEWNKHLIVTNSAFSKPQKIYPDASGVLKLRTAGLPALASSPVGTPTGGAQNFIYRFHYKYTYTVGSVTYVDLGPTTEVAVNSAAAPNLSTIAWASIPALANSTTHNYDTASSDLKIMISRTINNGQVFFYAGSVNNGTTTFNDTMSDATLLLQENLYTEGGFVEVNEPYPAKVVFAVEECGYYANCKIGSEVHASRVYQTIPGDIDGIGTRFFANTPSEIMAGSSFRSIPILACKNGAYRIEGKFDAQGNGFMAMREISATATCVSERSMVQTPIGVFWCGVEGFYWSDGYQCLKINRYWDKSHALLLDSATKWPRIQGKYDAKRNRVYWICCEGSASNDNDLLYALDLNFVGPSEDMPFTSWSGTSFAPTAIEFINGELIRGDKRGYILRHEDTLYSDPRIDSAVAAASWTTETIIYSFKSASQNFGTSFTRKWVPWISVQAQNETNLSLQIVSDNDHSRSVAELQPIIFKGNLVWGDADVFWGDNTIIWGGGGLIDQKRRFPKANLRCDYKQIYLTNAYLTLYTSDDFGPADVTTSTSTAVLDGSDEWPTTAIDYYISFESDGYEREYLIETRTDDTIEFTDGSGNAADATDSGWEIRGYPRNEVLFLIGFIINYAMFGQTQEAYRASNVNSAGDE
jgi:hypothetical protein